MKKLSLLFLTTIVFVHFALVLWGIFGFIEYFYPAVPWIDLQNASFPPGMQFLHWLAILSGGGVFLLGYTIRWKYTPSAMAIIYTMMATLCAVQTLDLLTNQWKYQAMILEYTAYLCILYYLFRSRRVNSHFRTKKF